MKRVEYVEMDRDALVGAVGLWLEASGYPSDSTYEAHFHFIGEGSEMVLDRIRVRVEFPDQSPTKTAR